jgi:peroxiredoxin
MLKANLLATIAVLAAAAVANGQAADTSSLMGKPAPGFTLKTTAGQTVKLSDLRGKVVVLDFWATWCPPCRASLPHVQALSTDQARVSKGLVVLAINEQEAAGTIDAFMKRNKFTFTVPMDGDGAVSNSYLVEGIPTTVVIGPHGNVREVAVGFGPDSAAVIEAAVDKALARVGK